MITFPDEFDLTSIDGDSSCRSVFLGVGTIYEASYSLWYANKVIGIHGEDETTAEYGDYILECEVTG